MSATTPAVRGGIGNQRLGAALAVVAVAIVAIIAMVAFATANRTSTAAPAAGAAPAAQAPVLHDRGWAMDSGKLATPIFSVPGDHGSLTDTTAPSRLLMLPRVVDPYHPSDSVVRYSDKNLLALPRVLDPFHADNAIGSSVGRLLALPRVFDPYHNDAPATGGRGTRMAQ